MPKVTVQYPKVECDMATELSVRWVKDSFVQLHAQRHVYAVEPVQCVNGCNEADTTACSECPPSSADIEKLAAEVWTDNLDRKQVNDLITTLRRARDQVFGRDA